MKQNLTYDIKAPNEDLEILRKHFSQCFDKDGNFLIEKFTSEIKDKDINFSRESYGIDWLGKSYARLLACDAATTLLRENETHNHKPDNLEAQNLLLKGDNLEMLKHLSNAYHEKIKMIYIDPPYNTGGDGFVYEDDRKFTIKELQQLAGVSEERAKHILTFTKSNSNSHSAWLTFMYPRLFIAKKLLKQDGVIFISIDDNEVAQLRLLMDEIFGEENFVAELPTIMNLKGNNDEFGFAGTHEYTIVYAKNKSIIEFKQFIINEDDLDEWTEDEIGFYKQGANLKRTGQNAPRADRPNLYFPIFIDSNDFVYVTDDNNLPQIKNTEFETLYPITNGLEMSWRWSKNKIKNESKDIIVSRNGTIGLYKKQRPALGDMPSKKPKTIFYKPEYSSGNGTAQIKNLLGDKFFSNPKPINLIKDLLEISTSTSDLILDFFAGSGTTGDAVMQLNAEDGGNRKFILVQIPEPIDPKKNKVAFDFVNELALAQSASKEKEFEPTIFEITKERLLRAAKKINVELDEKSKNLQLKIKKLETELQTADIKTELKTKNLELKTFEKLKTQNCFKIFETMPIWEDYEYEEVEFNPNSQLFDFEKLTEYDLKALLTTWKTNDNIPLTENLITLNLGGYLASYGKEKGKLYLMNKGFTTDNLVFLLEKIDSDREFNPTAIIAFGYHFDSKNMREIAESIKSYRNKKSLDIDYITRY